MASKRMIRKDVIDTDAFLDMPLSTQALYFHLNLRADDDGFVGNPKRITALIGASEDDLKLLIAKNFVILFENGVIVIKHWRMHNTLSASRYHETNFTDEKAMLKLKDNKSYTLGSGHSIDDTKLIESGKRQTKDEQKTNADIDIDLDKDIDINNKRKDIPKGISKRKPNVFFSDGTLQTTFEEFMDMRKKIKKPMTDGAIERCVKKVNKLSNNNIAIAIEILRQSIDHCWLDVYELKDNKRGNEGGEQKRNTIKRDFTDEELKRFM